jgi:hypothetical protein
MKKLLTIFIYFVFTIAHAQTGLGIDKPNYSLTPGSSMTDNLNVICVSGYSATVRNVSEGLKQKVYKLYSVPKNERGSENGIEISKIDHLIPLAIGGSNDITNLWPHYYNTQSGMGVLKKNIIENTLHRKVCQNEIEIHEAWKCIALDWQSCYYKHVPLKQQIK